MKNIYFIISFSFFLFISFISPVRATDYTIYSSHSLSHGANSTYSWSTFTGSYYLGFSSGMYFEGFTGIDDLSISQIVLKIKGNSTTTDYPVVSVYSDCGTTFVASSTATMNLVNGSWLVTPITIDNPFDLTPNTKYWFKLTSSASFTLARHSSTFNSLQTTYSSSCTAYSSYDFPFALVHSSGEAQELIDCESDLSQCEIDLDTASSSLASTTADLSLCNGDLDNCESDLSTCQSTLDSTETCTALTNQIAMIGHEETIYNGTSTEVLETRSNFYYVPFFTFLAFAIPFLFVINILIKELKIRLRKNNNLIE